MADDPLETLSSFIDGEIVDPSELEIALAEADSHEFMISAARLRHALHRKDVSLTDPTPGSLPRFGALRVAIAVVAISALMSLSWLAGSRIDPNHKAPPKPDRVVTLSERAVHY